LSERSSANMKDEVLKLKDSLEEIKTNVLSIRNALEKVGLTIIEKSSSLESIREEVKEQSKRVDNLEIAIRGLRFTLKEGLKAIEKYLKNMLDAIKGKEVKKEDMKVEHEEIKVENEVKEEPSMSPPALATEEVLNRLSSFVKSQKSVEEVVNKIAETRDMIMKWTPYHPVLYEMHEWMQKIKKLSNKNTILDVDLVSSLLTKIEEWKARILK